MLSFLSRSPSKKKIHFEDKSTNTDYDPRFDPDLIFESNEIQESSGESDFFDFEEQEDNNKFKKLFDQIQINPIMKYLVFDKLTNALYESRYEITMYLLFLLLVK
jgi:hypothetical protein